MKKEVDMEPIFTVKCKCTEKEYFRFYRYLLFKRYKWLSYLSLLFITALVVSFIVTSLLGGLIDWKSSLSPMACFLFYFLCIFYILPYSAVRRFRKNKLARDLESEISFFEDHIETVNKYENFTCPYEKMDRILETKTNVYIMIQPNSGLILRKQDFPEGALEFIHQVMKQHNW